MEQGLSLFLNLDAGSGGRAFDEKNIGRSFGYVGIVSIIVQGGLIRSLSKRYSERILIIVGWIVLAIGLAGIGYFGWAVWPLAPLAVAGLLMAVGNSISMPSLNSLVSRTSSATTMGSTFGAQQSMSALARIVGPLSAGWVADLLTRAAPMYVAAGGTTIALLIFFGVKSPPKAES